MDERKKLPPFRPDSPTLINVGREVWYITKSKRNSPYPVVIKSKVSKIMLEIRSTTVPYEPEMVCAGYVLENSDSSHDTSNDLFFIPDQLYTSMDEALRDSEWRFVRLTPTQWQEIYSKHLYAGYEIGSSCYHEQDLREARAILKQCEQDEGITIRELRRLALLLKSFDRSTFGVNVPSVLVKVFKALGLNVPPEM